MAEAFAEATSYDQGKFLNLVAKHFKEFEKQPLGRGFQLGCMWDEMNQDAKDWVRDLISWEKESLNHQ